MNEPLDKYFELLKEGKLNFEDLPLGWYQDSLKVFEIGEAKIALFNVTEMTMGNDMGQLAVASNSEEIKALTDRWYRCWENPFPISNRYLCFSSKQPKNTSKLKSKV